MNRVVFSALALSLLGLLGCDESRVSVSHSVSHEHSGRDFVPHLKAYHLIDSYGIDTARDDETPLTLDPYHEAGLFEIDWRVDSLEDYEVRFRLNDRPSVNGSVGVYSEVCGEGLPCNQEAIRICQYYPDLTLACGLDEYAADVSALVTELPQRLYALLEVCDSDSGYCEYDYYPVWLE